MEMLCLRFSKDRLVVKTISYHESKIKLVLSKTVIMTMEPAQGKLQHWVIRLETGLSAQ